MAPRQLRVLAIDDDEDHANYMSSMLPALNFQAIVYSNSQSALDFLKDHAEDVDFVLVAVSMEEMSGFQFIDIATNMRRNVQVILMSTTATWTLFRRAVAHGARFVVNKPLQDTAMRNIWQYLDLSEVDRMGRIQHLIQGPTEGQSDAESCVINSSGDHNDDEEESMDNSTSKMQGSTDQIVVNCPNSKEDETPVKCYEGEKGAEASTSQKK